MDEAVLGERLYRVRRNYCKSIEKYCELLEVSVAEYLDYERGFSHAPSELLIKISKLTGCDTDYFISELCQSMRKNLRGSSYEISDSFRMIRKNHHRSQEEVAAALGIARSTYSGYERAVSVPSWDIILKLSRYYGVSVNYLLGFEKEEGIDSKWQIKMKTQKR